MLKSRILHGGSRAHIGTEYFNLLDAVSQWGELVG